MEAVNTDQSRDFRQVLWLARREIVRLRTSYLLTAAFMLFAGTLTASVVEAGALGQSIDFGASDAIFADVVILMLTTLLATNLTFWGSYSDWSTSSERKLSFFRSLPIPVSTLVGSRMVSMLFALPLNVLAFFIPLYLVVDLAMDLGTYIAFIIFWIGYALIWAGLNLYVELVKGGRYFFWFCSAMAALLLVLIGSLGVVLGVRIVYEVGQLVSNHGLVAAPISLLAGIAAFLLAGRSTTRGLLGREIPV